MAFMQFEDLNTSVELIAFPDSFAKYEALLRSEQPLRVVAVLEKDNDLQSSSSRKRNPWTSCSSRRRWSFVFAELSDKLIFSKKSSNLIPERLTFV